MLNGDFYYKIILECFDKSLHLTKFIQRKTFFYNISDVNNNFCYAYTVYAYDFEIFFFYLMVF